MDLTF